MSTVFDESVGALERWRTGWSMRRGWLPTIIGGAGARIRIRC